MQTVSGTRQLHTCFCRIIYFNIINLATNIWRMCFFSSSLVAEISPFLSQSYGFWWEERLLILVIQPTKGEKKVAINTLWAYHSKQSWICWSYQMFWVHRMVILRGIWPVPTHYRGILKKLTQNSSETLCKLNFTIFHLFSLNMMHFHCHSQIIRTCQVPMNSFYHYFCFSHFNMLFPFLQGFACCDEQNFRSGDFSLKF